MSAVSKLAIRGVRAFSPDDEQAIEFYTPLTMIVGANGCGKTTIIECLKYSTTGAMPPGVGPGASFVHDPKLSGMTEVKGLVKLRFLNTGGKMMVVVRTMQVKQLKVRARRAGVCGFVLAGERARRRRPCSSRPTTHNPHLTPPSPRSNSNSNSSTA